MVFIAPFCTYYLTPCLTSLIDTISSWNCKASELQNGASQNWTQWWSLNEISGQSQDRTIILDDNKLCSVVSTILNEDVNRNLWLFIKKFYMFTLPSQSYLPCGQLHQYKHYFHRISHTKPNFKWEKKKPVKLLEHLGSDILQCWAYELFWRKMLIIYLYW